MAKIPDAQTLGVRTPNATRSIASYDGSAGAKGMIAAGRELQQFGANAQVQIDKNEAENDRLEAAKASLFYKQTLDAFEDEAKANPDDYQNYIKKFDSIEKNARSQAAGMIRNESKRGLFDVAAQEVGGNRRRSISDMQTSVNVDKTFAYVADAVEKERVRQMQNPDPNGVMNMQVLTKNAIDPLVKTGQANAVRSSDFLRQANESVQDAYFDADIRKGGMDAFKRLDAMSRGGVGQPKNFNADTVKPYDAKRISDIKAMVAAPSQYDSLFAEMGEKYGVDPQELKLRAAVESGLNPTAQAKATPYGQSGGLMQLEVETAKRLGVTDRNDPRQSVEGAAKLLAEHQTKAGGDQTKVDKLYYAGSESMMGPNTEQYAANLAAVRGNGAPAEGSYLPFTPSADSLTKALTKARGYAEIEVRDKIKDLAVADKMNVAIPKEVIDAIRADAKNLGMVGESKALDDFDAARDVKAEFSRVPLSEMPAAIRKTQLEAQSDISKAKTLEVQRAVYANKLDGLNKTPYEYYQANNIIPPVEQSMLSGNTKDEVIRRRQYAKTVMDTDGFSLPMITSDEVDQVVLSYKDGGKVGEVLSGVMLNLTSDERKRVAHQIAKKDAFLGGVAAIDDPDTMNIAIAGSRADGHAKIGDFKDAIENTLSGAFATGKGLDDAMQVAYAYYKQAAVTKGLTSSDPVDTDLAKDAISRTIGNVDDVSVMGLVSRVVVPNGMSTSALEDRLESLTREDISAAGGVYSGQPGAPYSPEPEQLFSGRELVSYGDGMYILRNSGRNDDYLMNGSGTGFFIIDVNKIRQKPLPTGASASRSFIETLKSAEKMGR